jgi:hypothetical protein
MMLRSLVDEVVRRRLWPIPVIAILIMIAAPVLFMNFASEALPDPPGPPAAPGKLSPGDRKLLSGDDRTFAPHEKLKGKGQDPFAQSSRAAKAADDTATAPAVAAASPASSGTTSTVVVQNPDGSSSTMPATKQKATVEKKVPAKKTTPKVVVPEPTTSSAAARATVTYVDARFGQRMGTMLRYRIPRLQTFRAGGNVAAMFVRYSTTRDVAVFAIAPSTKVDGDVSCRKVKNVCRYVDIPAGSYARLRLLGRDGSVISRRLDVVSIRHLPLAGNEDAMPRATTGATASCLLKGLLRLPASLPSISFDACD